MQIYIYGTGSKTLKYLPALLIKYRVLGFVDSSLSDENRQFMGLPVYHYSNLSKLTFDKVVIVSSYKQEIVQNLFGYNYTTVESLPDIGPLVEEYNEGIRKNRYEISKAIPQTALKERTIRETQFLTNRESLLRAIPSRGIGAEIGVAAGNFTSEILRINMPEKLHLVDVWGSERYGTAMFQSVEQRFKQQISTNQIAIHRKLSTEAVGDFPDHYFDWIYIDTSHCYSGTKAELELYVKKIKRGGIIAGHDYVMGNWVDQVKYGVIEAVHEFCEKYNWRLQYLTMDIGETQSFAIRSNDIF